MSPLARALLALAAAALLHAAAADQCTTATLGSQGDFSVKVRQFETDQTDSVHELPMDACPTRSIPVGVTATACDPYGNAPSVEFLNYERVLVTCSWTGGQTCPHHLSGVIYQNCKNV